MNTARKWVYSLGSLGSALTSNAFNAWVVFFYVDVLKAPAALIASAMATYSLWNAINDPMLGFISDRTRTRLGRRIPYIAAGWLPLIASFALIWAPPASIRAETGSSLIWYFFLAICLYDFLYTMVVLNWTALFPEMYPRLGERSSVSAMRQMLALVGLIVGVAFGSTVAKMIGWDRMGLLFGAIGGVSLGLSILGARENPRFSQAQSLSLWPALKHTLANRSFLTFALVSFTTQLTFGVVLAAVPFYTKYVLRLDEFQHSLVLIAVFITIAVMLPLWSRRTVRVGPRRAMQEGIVLYLVTLTGFWVASDLAGGIVAGSLIGIGIAAIMLLLDVLISDVIDEDELRTLTRREGMYFGMHALVLRLNGTVQALILGAVLTWSRYDPNLGVGMQPPSAILGLRLLMTVVPAVILLLAAVFIWLYPLHGESLERVRRRVEELHAREASSLTAAASTPSR